MSTLAPFTAANLEAQHGIRHGFFTRLGGVSTGIYASLNCGIGSNDAPDAVLENRRRVAAHLGGAHLNSAMGGVTTLYQEHGATALTVSAPVERANLPRADAVVSATPGLVIGVLTADCGPVLFADAKAGIVAAAHAGWRGAVCGILENTLAEMERLGAQRDRIVAALGPCIHQPAYEVGEDFVAEVVRRDGASRDFFAVPPGAAKPHFNLPGYIMHRLTSAGLRDVVNTQLCTHVGESQLFSYRRTTQRREPDYGRQISAIVVA